MPYVFKRLTGDGDCFFHGIADFVNAAGSLHRVNAREVRRRIAARAANELFPTVLNPLDIINQLSGVMVQQKVAEETRAYVEDVRARARADWWNQQRSTLEEFIGPPEIYVDTSGLRFPDPDTEIQHILQQLPDPVLTNDVSEVALKEAIPYALLKHWSNVPFRKAILVFFLYWYQRSYSDCLDLSFNQLAGHFGQGWCRYCIHGDLSMNMEGSGQDSGFAAHMVYQEFNINLCAVYRYGDSKDENTLAYLRLCAQDPAHAYLVHSGIHFDAAVWEDQVVMNDLDYQFDSNWFQDVPSLPFAPISRAVGNSHRASFLFGAAVWNMNHLSPPVASTAPIIETKKRGRNAKASGPATRSKGGRKAADEQKTEAKAPKIDKNPLKLKALDDLGANNNLWLDVLGLNEVNNVQALAGLKNWIVRPGPRMLSVTANGGALRGGQPEFYPLLIAKNVKREFQLEYNDCYCVDSKGDVRWVFDYEEVKWTKPANEFAVAQHQESVALADQKRLVKPSLKARENAELDEDDFSESEEDDAAAIDDSEDEFQDEDEVDDDPLGYGGARTTKKIKLAHGQLGEGSAIQTGSKSAPDQKEEKMEEDKKPEGIHVYRPVVVHRLVVDRSLPGELQINVAILHTTPSGSEYERWEVYRQLDAFFRGIGDEKVDRPLNKKVPVHWIVLGYFYLFEESRITKAVQETFLSSGGGLQLKKFYQDEKTEYDKARKTAEDSQNRLDVLKRRLQRIKELTAQFKGLENALKRTSNGAFDDLAGKFDKLMDECQTAKCPDALTPTANYTFEDFKALAIAVSKLFEFNFPFANADRWIDWWIHSIPKCLEQGLIESQHLSWTPPADIIARGLNQASEKLKGADLTPDNRIDICKQLLADYRVLLAHVKAWNAKEFQAAAENADAEREKYVAPLSAFEKNARMSEEWMNRLRNVLGTSFAAQMKSKFHVLQTVWGTNIHTAAVINSSGELAPRVEYSAFRIADFAVCSKTWRSCELGLFHHQKGGLIRVDDKCVTTTVHWRGISDHFPIGGRFSLGAHDRRVQSVFVEEQDVDFVAARNVLYIRDIFEVICPEADMKAFAKFWPDRESLARDAEQKSKQSSSIQSDPSFSLYAPVFEEFKAGLLEALGDKEAAAAILVELSELKVTDPNAYDLLRRVAEVWATLYPRETSYGIWQLDVDGAKTNLTAFEPSTFALFPELAALEAPVDPDLTSSFNFFGSPSEGYEDTVFLPDFITFNGDF